MVEHPDKSDASTTLQSNDNDTDPIEEFETFKKVGLFISTIKSSEHHEIKPPT
jgi:hypothetical protein